MNPRPDVAEPARHETIDGDARQVVWSPEQVALHLPIAGPASRMLAYAIDAVVIVALEAAAFVLLFLTTPLLHRVAGPLRRLAEDLSTSGSDNPHGGNGLLVVLAVLLLVQFIIEWSYFVFWELVSGGRSLGKLCVKLRVMRDGGAPITARESLIRNLLRMVDFLPGSYVVGLVSVVMSRDGKRLGDLAAGTVVVRMDRPEAAPPVVDDGAAPEIASFRFDRAQIARLGTTERALLRQTLRRLETLPADKAEEILATAVDVLCQRLGHEPVEHQRRKAFLMALLHATRRQ